MLSSGTSGSVTNFNPRSPHGERLSLMIDERSVSRISIHAPRMGSDLVILKFDFSHVVFQSTLPAWGATFVMYSCFLSGFDFNPRSPHGERHPPVNRILAVQDEISIHAPRMGSD